MKNNLLKYLIAATVIIFTVDVGEAWAEDVKSNLPICNDPNKIKWNNCFGERGYFVDNNLHKYKGEFRDGAMNGIGTFTLQNGDKYIGEFKNDNWEGMGTYTFGNGNKYEGEFKQGKPNGVGIITLKDGQKYVGELKNSNRDGYGIHTWANGSNYVGGFKDDKFNGRGTFTSIEGDIYEGEFKNGVQNGIGIFTFAVGNSYAGEWIDGKPHGKGREVFVDGRAPNEGIFENGNFIKEQKISLPSQLQTKPSFDCVKAKSLTEKLICADAQLSAMDMNLFNYYVQARFITKNQVDFKKENIAAWTKREKECSNKKCLIEWYDSRRDVFEKIINNANSLNSNEQLIANNRYNFNVENKRSFQENKNLGEEKKGSLKSNDNLIKLQVTNTQANTEGDFVINIQTGTDTASLKINGEEFGGRADGNYTIKKVARAGQESKFTIVAKDTNGNTDSKTISVTRQVTASNAIKYAELNPALVKIQPNKDAVAIVIGIADYKNLPRADFANDDARAFYDYAIRALGVKAENIKLLVDADAGQGEIYKAFKTWLPSRVKATTDVYVYYSGHGLPATDGQSLYLLPQLADRDLIEETAIAQSKINAAIQATKPKSVTIFLDSCYSGAGRTGQTLLASARPIAIKSTAQAFPAEFTVISASTAEQISSSSNELKHGIFSYYLMRGMEGEADANKDGKITTGEMHAYLTENVARQASLANRVQNPQLNGDVNRVLIGK